METTDQIKFKRTLRKVGNGGLNLSIPPEMVEYLGIKEGDIITITPEKNKNDQKYGVFYNEQD